MSSRYSAIDLAAYEVADVIERLDAEGYLARDRAQLTALWETRRAADPALSPLDALLLDSDPSSLVLQVGAFRETLLRGRVNDAMRALMLASALGPALDHIGATYYRATRRDGEDDETYRQRLALAPESWSCAGPQGAYVYFALSASADVLDVAIYSEDEAACLAPQVRAVVLQTYDPDDPAAIGEAEPALLAAVQAALRRSDIRPMGDLVAAESAVPLPFDLTINLRLRSGASQAMVLDGARRRVLAYCRGRLRWAGDGEVGPVWLIGRTLTVESIAGVAMGGDPNILEADVAGGDINAPHPDYEAALTGVGARDFEPPPDDVVAHLFRAPRLVTLTITATLVATGWTA